MLFVLGSALLRSAVLFGKQHIRRRRLWIKKMSMALRAGILAGKTAFIAGGSSGINLGIAHGLAEGGARIGLISRSRAKVDAAVRELQEGGCDAVGFAADVRDFTAFEGTVRATHAAFGDIDIVVSGAAGNFVAPVLGMSANGFKAVVDIDLLGTLNVFRASYAYLRKPGASLIAITAGQAVQPTASQAQVCAAKAGVNAPDVRYETGRA